MKYLTSLVALALLALAFVGCSKASPDLGVIEVSDGVQSQHDMGGGRVCIIRPAIQTDGSIMLALRIEEGGKVLATARAQTSPDRAVEIAVGDIGVMFTPHVKK
jgi:hypothetical protein